MTNRIWGIVLVILLVWLVPQPWLQAATIPQTYSENNISSPIPDIPEDSATLEVARVRSGLLPGIVIGGHYEGLLNVLQEHYTAVGWLDERLADALCRLLEDELSLAGYNVAPKQASSLFDEQLSDTAAPGRLLLGGTITQTSLNSYSWLFHKVTKEQRTVRWELFDRELGKVVYRQETGGTSVVEGIRNPAATYEAIQSSIRALLTTPAFAAAVSQPPVADITPPPTMRSIAAIASAPQPLSTEQIAGRTIPAVVRIRTTDGRGTGFLLSPLGLIVTNQHVVGSAFSVKVDLYDGSTQTGRVLQRDRFADVALVKLIGETSNLPGLPICQTNAVKVGEPVVAIGNPLSYSNTVTQGVVSGFRTASGRELIQTDAAVNPGNSGGPLLNRYGTVIGIVTEKVSSRGVEGLGFALPIAEALQTLHIQVHPPATTKLNACGNPMLPA